MGVYGYLWVFMGFYEYLWVSGCFLGCGFWVFIVFIGSLSYLLIQRILFVFDISNFCLIILSYFTNALRIDFTFCIEIHNLKIFYFLQQETV